MKSADFPGQAPAPDDRYRALLAISEAIVAHRDLPALFNELAGQLNRVVRFDYLAFVLHDPATDTMRLHVLGTRDATLVRPSIAFSLEDDPAGMVWQTQQPYVIASLDKLTRWQQWRERVQAYGVESLCFLPLTTARRQLGTLNFSCTERSAYDEVDLGFLQLVAKQVAVAVENALAFEEMDAAFREIRALKDQLAKEKAYLEDEVRTEHNFGEVVGRQCRAAPGSPTGRDGRPDRLDCPHSRRNRDGQRTDCQGNPRPEPTAGPHARQAELRGYPHRALGERVVRT